MQQLKITKLCHSHKKSCIKQKPQSKQRPHTVEGWFSEKPQGCY